MPHLRDFGADFRVGELLAAAGHLKDRKAPEVEDGIVGEWVKVLLHAGKAKGSEAGTESSLVSEVVLRLFSAVWKSGCVPSCWRVATVVSYVRRVTPRTCIIVGGSLLRCPTQVITGYLDTPIGPNFGEEWLVG